jgi:hypothetical protein
MSTVCIFFVYAFACLTDCINVVFTVENVEKSSICTPELDSKKIQQFSDAIESSYCSIFHRCVSVSICDALNCVVLP